MANRPPPDKGGGARQITKGGRKEKTHPAAPEVEPDVAENRKGTEKSPSEEVKGGVDFQQQQRKFWAAKTASSRNRESGVSLLHFPQLQGADSIVIPEEEWKAATSKFDQALVGFVFGTKPYLGRMRGFARVKWGDEAVVKVSQLNDGIFLFKFSSEDKKLEVLSGGPWTFDNRPLILKPWSEQENYKCGSVDALPVWVRLPGIKAHLTDISILSRLCS